MSNNVTAASNSSAQSTEAEAAKSSKKKERAQSGELDEWKEQARSRLLNLSVSNQDVLDFLIDSAQDEDFSIEKSQALNFLMNLRTEMATLLTNGMRALFDAANAVIHNIRA